MKKRVSVGLIEKMLFEKRLEGGMEGGERALQNNPGIFQNIPRELAGVHTA